MEKEGYSIIDAIKKMMKNIKGAFSTILATKKALYMFRDPYAFRPMTYGKTKEGSVVVASESCALDILYMDWKQEIKPAEIIIVTKNGIESIENNPNDFRSTSTEKHCIFEHIYFSRPDSFIFKENVYQVRQKIGNLIAEDDDINADVVVPVPDSSNIIALGYARNRNIPFEFGLIRNHYVGRTFIQPEQTIRDESVFQKFNPLPNFFDGKIIILIDDSIVRGTTLRKLTKLIKHAGAKEVHLRIGSPPVKNSCFYGIDTPTRKELIANNKKIEEIRDFIGADSLKYFTIEQLRKTVKEPKNFCYACFDGNYPVK